MDTKQVLKTCHVFAELSEAQVEKVTGLCRVESYEAGETIFAEASSARKLYVLEQGKVALQVHLPALGGRQGRRVTVDIVTPPEIFGWSAVVESHPYALTAICLEPSKVAAVDGTMLKSLLAADHEIAYHVLRKLISVVASRLDEARQLLISERTQALA